MENRGGGRKLVALYPGTFDPITNGHLDIIVRALSLFDELVVGVACNTQKRSLFSLEERTEMVRQATAELERVRVEPFETLTVEFARRVGAALIVRGIRAVSDFEYEFQMALTNRRLAPELETVFLMPRVEFSFLSSKLIKEVAAFGGDVSPFVPPAVNGKLIERLAGGGYSGRR